MTIDEVTNQVPEGCPVVHFDIAGNRPALGYFAELDRLREEHPYFWDSYGNGFWVLTRFDSIREAYQKGDVFSSESIIVTDPDPDYRWIPTHIDGPDHVKFRQALNRYFSPNAVKRREPVNRQIANEVIDGIVGRGRCDLAYDFAGEFPTRAFLAMCGLPGEDAPRFVQWVTTIFSNMFNTDDHSAQLEAAAGIHQYFVELLAERRANPRDPDTDFMTHLIQAEKDGEPLLEEDLLNICDVLILAGLDTMKCQLGYSFYHFATHPEDRRRIVADPDLVPSAVEEILRYYTIVTPGRKLTEDYEIDGCPMKKGQMVWLDLAMACRDPRAFPDADEFIIDRERNQHLAFAAGAHRCLGSHLARSEMVIALQEWHRRIPDYELDTTEALTEHGGQFGLNSLPIRWAIPSDQPAGSPDNRSSSTATDPKAQP
jgi:cytochrome P450